MPEHKKIFPLRRTRGLFWLAALASLFLTISSPGQDDDASRAQIAEGLKRVGKWVWDKKTFDKQTVYFWNSFAIPKGAFISNATLYITADNGYELWLDGRELGRGSDWKTLTEYDLKYLLKPGIHTLAVEAFNDRLAGGLMFGMRIEIPGQKPVEILSDESWKIVPPEENNWQTQKFPRPYWASAIVVGKVNDVPWKPWPYAIAFVPPLRPPLLHFWQTLWFQITLLTILGIVVLICLWLVTQLTVQSKAQRLLHLQRARIARDIHDDIGARLTQLVLMGEIAQSGLTPQSEVRTEIDHICEQARGLAHAMDEIVWAVSSRRDTLRDFAAYVCKYTQLFLKDTPIRCRLDVEPDLPPVMFDLATRRNLLLAVKEAVNNAAKYSGASELFLRIHREGDNVRVVVEDNGRGFDLSEVDTARNGLENMTQRMQEVKGHFRIDTAPDYGCRVEFNLPLTLSRRSRWLGWLWRDGRVPVEPESPPLTAAGELEKSEANPS
jgi:signal transduction histidine kinase